MNTSESNVWTSATTLSLQNYTYHSNYEEEWPELDSSTYASMLALACITNIIGNTCTLFVFLKVKRLRSSIQSIYILNLAVTDLSQGIVTLPLMTVWYFKYDHWPFGAWVCKFLWVVDFLMCAESACTVLLISYDRWLLVKGGAHYNVTQTQRRVCMKIGATWMIAFLLYTPAIIGYDYWRGYSTQHPGDCDVEFAEEGPYNIFTALVEFIIPFGCICMFNCLTFIEIKRRSNRVQPITHKMSKISESKSSQSRSSKKAALSLAAVVVVFLICWLPYSIVNLINTFCDECITPAVVEIVDWILWMNSSINPFIYVLTNNVFRKTLLSILFPCIFSRDQQVQQYPQSTHMATVFKTKATLSEVPN